MKDLPILEADSPLSKVKQETPTQDERPFESERLTANGILEIVEHDPFVFFRDSSIPLSTDFAERVLPLISNQMGPAPSRFRYDDQEQVMRTVANENENENGRTNDPNSKLTDKVSTNIRDEGQQTQLKPPIIETRNLKSPIQLVAPVLDIKLKLEGHKKVVKENFK